MIDNDKLKIVYNKTQGHCHFCGDPLIFNKYGLRDINNIDGAWEADHVIQKGKGGTKNFENCLPTCVSCNRLRWHRSGQNLRDLIFLGLVAVDEIKKNTEVGKKLVELKEKRVTANIKRRRKI